MHQQIIFRSSQTNPNFFNDIIHYYPGLLQQSYRNVGNFAHTELEQLAKWGIKDGLFRDNIDINTRLPII